MKKRSKKANLLLITIISLFLSIYNVNAMTITETTIEDEYDTIESNTIIIGVTKFEPNETLTAGKVSLATYNDTQYNYENESYQAPKIYYYLQGSWFEIDNDNNAIVIEDEKIIEILNKQDIFYVNNEEKVIDVEYEDTLSNNYELIFETKEKDKKIEYLDDKIRIPATVSNVSIWLKEANTENKIEIAHVTKEQRNSINYKISKLEKEGTDGIFNYALLPNGKIQISRYLGNETSVVIPAEYDGYKVYAVGNVAAESTSAKRYNIFGATNQISNSTITNITISEGIEVIEESAFSKCSNLVGPIDFPSTLKKIGAYSFNNCKKLKGELVFPEGIEEIGRTAFQNCESLTGTLIIPSNVTKIHPYTFNGCKKLTGDLIIPEGITYIGQYAFQNCSGFKGELKLPSTIEVIEDGAFNHCSNLTNETLTIPKAVKQIGLNETDGTHVFYDFANKTFKRFIVEEGSTKFKAVDGVLYNIEGTRLIGYPSSRPGEVYKMPEGVKIIDELSFSRAGSPWHLTDRTNTIKKLILPNSYVITTNLPSNYLNEGNSLAVGLYKYTGVTDIEVKQDNPNYKSINGILYSKDGKDLWWVPIVKSGEVVIESGTTTIKPGAFYSGWDRYQTSVVIPKTVTEIAESEIAELEILLKRNYKVTFEEGSIYEVKANKTIGKKE